MKTTQSLLRAVTLIGAIGFLANCNKGFVHEAEEQNFIANSQVFPTSDESASTNQSSTSSSSDSTPAPNQGPSRSQEPNIPSQKISRVCSNFLSKQKSGNIFDSQKVSVRVVDGSDKTLCEISDGVKDYVLDYKKIPLDFSRCDIKIRGGKLFATLVGTNATGTATSNLLISNVEGSERKITLNRSASGTWIPDNMEMTLFPKVSAVYALAPFYKTATGSSSSSLAGAEGETPNPETPSPESPSKENCDQSSSPLVINMNPNPSDPYLVLTRPTRGVLFDLLGANSFPKPHTKRQISWITSDQYMFVVLPDQNGEVNGIDQLFGNNTQGPKGPGDFASDGYAALAKYDGTDTNGRAARGLHADGVINEADPIYAKLRLWSDKNFDGVAEVNELFTLTEMGIKEISLKYDPNFPEATDAYGNETKMKSVVRMKDGSLRLIFDLWFSYL